VDHIYLKILERNIIILEPGLKIPSSVTSYPPLFVRDHGARQHGEEQRKIKNMQKCAHEDRRRLQSSI